MSNVTLVFAVDDVDLRYREGCKAHSVRCRTNDEPPQEKSVARAPEPKVGKVRSHVDKLGTSPPQYFTSAAINQPAAGGECGGGVFDFTTPQGTLTYPWRLHLFAGAAASDVAGMLQGGLSI